MVKKKRYIDGLKDEVKASNACLISEKAQLYDRRADSASYRKTYSFPVRVGRITTISVKSFGLPTIEETIDENLKSNQR